jgi:hypothetical protein
LPPGQGHQIHQLPLIKHITNTVFPLFITSTNKMSFDLSNPGRPIEAGVILMGETEVLDIAPIDLLHGISKKFVEYIPIPEEIKAKAQDINFHWITEKGAPGKLTSNMTITATV